MTLNTDYCHEGGDVDVNETRQQVKRIDAQRDAREAALDRISEAFAEVPLEELEREVERALRDARAHWRVQDDPSVSCWRKCPTR